MKYIITTANDTIIDCLVDHIDGAIEITDEQALIFRTVSVFGLLKYINGEIVENTDKLAEIVEGERIADLEIELSELELKTARGFLWLVKLLIQNGTIPLSAVPQQLIDYRDRVNEITAELEE